MRTRAQIGKLLYDSLSNATWTRLREAFLGQELIAVGTEIIYKYEILAHASPWTPTPPSGTDNDYRNRYRTLVTTYLSDPQRGWDVTTDVSKAVIDWATEVLYQAYLAVKKNKEDEVVDTASYVGLIEDSLKLTNPVPVSQCKPATLTVMLPVGNEVYPPYSVSISCGAAQFWNVKTYRSGEQATLYQGIPYYYGVDVSGLSEATYYDSTLQYVEKGTSTDRYVKLSSTALPESVQVYSLTNTYHLYNPSHQSFPAFRVITSRDGSIETHFSDGKWDAQSGDVNFVPGAEDWCIRFLDLTDTEFDINIVTLPDGYTLLSSEQANFTDIDYARRYFYKWQYVFDGIPGSPEFANIAYFLKCIPNVQDLNPNIVTNGGVIYIKPVENSENLIFDEVEDFLNTYYSIPDGSAISSLTTRCGYPRDFTIQIEIHNPAKFTTELRSRITEYFKKDFSYDKLSFFDVADAERIAQDIHEVFNLTKYTDFNVSLIASQGIYRSVINFIRPFTNDSTQMHRGTDVTAYSLTNVIYQLGKIKEGKAMYEPSVSLASCWGVDPSTTPNWAPAAYNLKSREFSSSGGARPGTIFTTMYDGFGVRGVKDTVGATTTLRVINTNTAYYVNPTPQTRWEDQPVFIETYDAGEISTLEGALSQHPFKLPGSVDALAFYSLVYDSTNHNYRINKYLHEAEPSMGSVTFPLPSTPTYVSYYNGDVYISCESAQIAIIKNLAGYMSGSWSIASGLFVYGIYDSESKIIEPCDQLEWSFTNCSPYEWGSESCPDFYACVGSDGGMSILTLDSEDPGTSVPSAISAAGTQSIARFNGYSEARKKQINSKWHFYTADRFKITAKGLQTINMREISTAPTLASCNEGTNWVALRYGPWKFSGRAIVNNLGVTSAYQVYYGRDEDAQKTICLLNTSLYDLINNVSAYSESATYTSAPGDAAKVSAYTSINVGTATATTPGAVHPDIVTLTGGSYAHNVISVVSLKDDEDGAVETSNATPDCYIELSDEIVKWI